MTKYESGMKFLFVVVVWGEVFTDLFLRLAIPNQLSPGNLPNFQYRSNSRYMIHTTREDAEVIRASRSFAMLSQIMPTEIVYIDDLDKSANKYAIVSTCQMRSLASMADEDYSVVFTYPDEVWSDGAFQALARIAGTGKRAIMVGGLNAVKKTALPTLMNDFYSESDNTVTISSRDLVALGSSHLDPWSRRLFWDSPNFNRTPSQLYWNAPDGGVLVRSYTPGPRMVRPRRSIKTFSGTLDGGDLVHQACPRLNDIHVVSDSDEIFLISLEDDLDDGPQMPNHASAFKVARWGALFSNKHQRHYFKQKVRFHSRELSTDWDIVELASDKVLSEVLFLLKFRIIFQLIDWKRSLGSLRWKVRHSRFGFAGFRLIRKIQARIVKP